MSSKKTPEQKLIDQELIILSRVNGRYRKFNSLVAKKVKKLGGWKVIQSNGDVFKSFKKDLPSLLRRAGLNDIIFDINPQLKSIENIALIQLSKDLSKKLTPVNVRNTRNALLSGIGKQNTRVFNDQVKWFNKKFTRKNLKGITSGNQFNQFIKQLTKKSHSEIDTLVRTSVQVYDNQTVTNKAEDLGLDKFRYAGANDSKNRPFCSERVGKIYTEEEAEKWDNGQISPANVTLGGYNCRHRKRYIVE